MDVNNKFHFCGGAILTKDDVDTDEIIPAIHTVNLDPKYLAKHCLEEVYPGFCDKVKPGDILIGGRNFGCGSSREQAPIAIKYTGISCVIAVSFSRLFYRNCINLAFPIMELPECVNFHDSDKIEALYETGIIRNITQGKEYKVPPVSEFVLEVFKLGGLLEYVENKKGEKNR
jgi:3-isopropylmalate/(R)-2-methylmalate dehydratase small subunit